MQKLKNSLVVVACQHGNEKYGKGVLARLPPDIKTIIANRLALEENKRFIDSDLNRCFPGDKSGNHEEKLAYNITNQLKDFNFVIDLHSSSNPCPMFGIITKPNNEKIEFAKKLGLKRLIIMPEFFASGKALIDFVKNGISIEVGPHNRNENIDEALELINNFITNENYNGNIEIYEVFNIIKKEQPNIIINNFQEIKKGETLAKGKNKKQLSDFDFTSVLVNEEAYREVLCLACKKVSL